MREGQWAEAPYPREQIMLMSPSLDEMIPADHRIRKFEEILNQVDWSEWETEYNGRRGQPPIHPRLVVGSILYGLTERLRSSRELEKATRLRMDFVWFLHARTIDHSTFSSFRTRFKERLNDMFKQLALIALAGSQEIVLAVDGTRIRSNSSRTGAITAATIEKRAAEIAADLTEALERLEEVDIEDDAIDELREQVRSLTKERDKLSEALEEANKRDEIRRKRRGANKFRPVRIPLSDKDSYIATNKEGGHAPNYTPTAAVDTETGAIVSAEIPVGEHEASIVESTVNNTKDLTGHQPKRMLFDNTFATGSNLKDLAEDGIEAYSSTKGGSNPVNRTDFSEPVPENEWDALPSQKKDGKTLTRAAFVYDRDNNCYWCPMGQPLNRSKSGMRMSAEKVVTYTEYRSSDCSSCPLAGRCLSRKAKHRMITRDEFEDHREALNHRMQTEQAREIYQQRAPVVEGTFAHIKHNMGIRQFLLRGIEKVRMEWLWCCAAFNVTKILKQTANA